MSSWDSPSPADILAEINALLEETWNKPLFWPQAEIMVSYSTYRWLLRGPLDLLLRSRRPRPRRRRPARFAAK